jgi:hypothetical protein
MHIVMDVSLNVKGFVDYFFQAYVVYGKTEAKMHEYFAQND